ncbi:MAG: sulfatase-like hydrolase/transferase [Chitinophagaceae bacterium]|nr:sulfatase-like hydrolase/transferase [Chitinophagaceae bacterium]
MGTVDLHKIKHWLQTKPLHLFLLPVFFIVNIYVQYAGLVSAKSSMVIFSGIATFMLLLFFGLNYFLNNKIKSGLITTLTGILVLYTGDIKSGSSLISGLHFLEHYRYFLPLIMLLFFFVVFSIYRSKKNQLFNLYLNVLFVFYTILAIAKLGAFINETREFSEEQKAQTTQAKDMLATGNIDKNKMPDIFFIMPDCYPSTSYQYEILQQDNSYFDSALISRGFFVVSGSRSNFNRTTFSIPSTIDMNYLHFIDTSFTYPAIEYSKALAIAKKASLFTFLKKYNYKTINLSIFNLEDAPAFTKENFIRSSEEGIILNNTIIGCFKRDFLWRLTEPAAALPGYLNNEAIEHLKGYEKHNGKVIDSLQSILNTTQRDSVPKIIYLHLYMPHYPYFNDSAGNRYPDSDVFKRGGDVDKQRFAGYIKYTNQKLLNIVDNILKNVKRETAIVLQSDHGFDDIDTSRPNDAFRNYKAIYFSDKNYTMLYDSMSNVNTFRVLLNKYFNQHLPILPDSSFYIK